MKIGCFSDPDTLDEGNTMKLADAFNEKSTLTFYRVCFFILLIRKTLNNKMIHLFRHLPIEVLKKFEDSSQCNIELIIKYMNSSSFEKPGFDEIFGFIRENSYMWDDEMDMKLVKKSDDELSRYEEEKLFFLKTNIFSFNEFCLLFLKN